MCLTVNSFLFSSRCRCGDGIGECSGASLLRGCVWRCSDCLYRIAQWCSADCQRQLGGFIAVRCLLSAAARTLIRPISSTLMCRTAISSAETNFGACVTSSWFVSCKAPRWMTCYLRRWCAQRLAPYYCQASMARLRAHTLIRYLVTTRMTVDGSTLFSAVVSESLVLLAWTRVSSGSFQLLKLLFLFFSICKRFLVNAT